MNVLLVGGCGSLINNLIIKFNKEGHRVYLLTGDRYSKAPYQKVFEKYNFPYDSNVINEIFESVNPDLTVFMGAYDTNFRWQDEEAEAVKFSSSLINIIMGYAMRSQGRFVFLSSSEVFDGDYPDDIPESEPTAPGNYRSMALAQAEEMCDSFRRIRNLDVMILRIDNLYSMPTNRKECDDVVSKMCLEELSTKAVSITNGDVISLIYVTDAVEFIYRAAAAKEHNEYLYNISSGVPIEKTALANMVQQAFGEPENIKYDDDNKPKRIVLSNLVYDSEFGKPYCCEVSDMIKKIAADMKNNPYVYLTGEEVKEPLLKRIQKKIGWFVKAIVPFVENIIAFVPFFMLNNRTVGSEYFRNLDFYLLYVLLFAIVYGQQQATFSAVLAVAGYLFRQAYERSGFELMLDANTYVWIAQLFILGLVVGYMRDQLKKLRLESEGEKDFLALQLHDIQDINSSNIRVKDALETQIVNQNDSVGKIYSITSALNQYSPEEVLFYAAEMVGKLIRSKDVAIYTVSNGDYARLFSSTSKKARMLGNSLQYTKMGELYDTLLERKVFINRKMDDRYPLMANAIYDDDKMTMIIMVWGIPWESMTLGQANQLIVISALIQNAVVQANRYMAALEDERYVEGSRALETEAFTSLMDAYITAERKGLTECCVLKIEADPDDYFEAGIALTKKLRNSDYIGTRPDGNMYALLSNTSVEDASFVINRFMEAGYPSQIYMEEVA